MPELSMRPAPVRPVRRSRAYVLFTSILLVLVSASAPAQRVVPTIDAAGSQVRYADSIQSSAATISPALHVDWDRATFSASGTFASFSGGWSTQGALGASIYTPSAGLFTGELTGTTGGSAHEDGSRTGQSLIVARAHLMSGGHGAWGGAGVGTTWDGGGWNTVRVAEVAAWSRLGKATLLGSITPTRVADTIRYTDLELAAHWDLVHVELGMSGGHRSGDRLPTLGGSAHEWGSVSATAWVSTYVAIVASGGTYPVDFTQGFPGGRFVSLGVRFGRRAPRHAQLSGSPNVISLEGRPEPIGGVRALRVATASGGQRTIRVEAPAAASVEITGDFTNWEPRQLTSAGNGWWTMTLALAPGTYEMNLRVNGGKWFVPPGVTAIRDEFGGTTGLLMVP